MAVCSNIWARRPLPLSAWIRPAGASIPTRRPKGQPEGLSFKQSSTGNSILASRCGCRSKAALLRPTIWLPREPTLPKFAFDTKVWKRRLRRKGIWSPVRSVNRRRWFFRKRNRLRPGMNSGDGWVRFVMSAHDPSQPLLIDPYVILGRSYFGGGLTDRISAMAVDGSGNIYLAGATESTDIAAPVRARADGVEAYVLKVNPSNLQVIYATYLGGTGDDRAYAIAVNSAGSVTIAGQTGSTNFPSLSELQRWIDRWLRRKARRLRERCNSQR